MLMKGKEWENNAGKKKQKFISYTVDAIFGYINMCSVGSPPLLYIVISGFPENAKFKQI